jgi:hyaluronate lyase
MHSLPASGEDKVIAPIVIRADATEGVGTAGRASLDRPLAGLSPEELKSLNLEGRQAMTLGIRSKICEEESKVWFSPELPQKGYYDVYIQMRSQAFRANQANPIVLTVHHAGGENEFQFSQDMGYVWAFLGTYPFHAGRAKSLSADAQGSLGISSIMGAKWVPAHASSLSERPRVLPVKQGSQDIFDEMRIHAAKLFTPMADLNLSNPSINQMVAQNQADVYLYWKTMLRQPDQLTLWRDLPVDRGKPIEKNEGGGWPLMRTFERVTAMAEAYVGSNAQLGFADKMQGNPELLEDILYALEWLYTNRYNERSINKLGAEWIAMEVNIPIHIAKTLLLIYPQVSREMLEKQLETMNTQSPGPDRFYGQAISTGSNRFLGVYAFALRSILAKDAAAMDRINRLIEDEYGLNSRTNPLVRSDNKISTDGFYADGSFIQHGEFPYIGVYGRALIGRFAMLQALLAGSPWAIDDPRSEIFFDWVYRGYAPLFFDGEIMYGSLGRSTGQSWHQNGVVSTEIMDALVQLVPGSPPEHQARLKSIFRAWLLDKANAAYPQFSELALWKLSPDTFDALVAIREDESITPERPAPGTTLFHNTDYVVHHQPDFAVQLRMFSSRIKTHEDINEGTNRLGWYQGEGTLFLYNRDNSRYHDHFWATVNPYRLPGITVDPHPRETPGSKNGELSTSPWAGGVQLDGFGLASMGLAAVESSLTARKAWFFFNDQIVCLGHAIRSTDNRAIETIVENVKLHGDTPYAFVVNGQRQPDQDGWTATLKDTRWAHLAGQVPGTDVGWVFPGGAELKALREQRTGNWQKSFVRDRDGADHTRRYLTLWYDHGPNPTDASYAYIVLPGRTTAQTQAYADNPGVQIVENSPLAQTVRAPALGVTGANFWTDQPHTSGPVTSSGKAAVLVTVNESNLSVAVADPTQEQSKVEIKLATGVSRALEVDEKISVKTLNPLTLVIDLQHSEGRTFTARFAR